MLPTMADYLRTKLPRELLFPLIILIFVLALVALKINGSSIGMFNRYFYGDGYKDSNLLLGIPRGIRSDEWAVTTPMSISQSQVDLQKTNPLIGLGEEMSVLGDLPTNHWVTIFRPDNLPFLVLPVENAFALKWWLKGFILITGTYFFVLVLSRKNYLLAIGAAFLMYFTPFVQWWYSVLVPESLGYLFFSLFSAVKVFEHRNTKELIFYTLLLAYFATCFAFILYLPFIVPLGTLGLLFFLDYLINNRELFTKRKLISFALSSIFVLVILVISLGIFYFTFEGIINIFRNTSYPGKREIAGGGFTLLQFFSGFYNVLLLRSKPIPPILGNQSEASSAFMFFPFLLPILIFYLIKRFVTKEKLDFILVGLTTYVSIVLTWMFIGLPSLPAKLLLLNVIPHNRGLIALVAANLIFVFYFLSRVKIQKNLDYKIVAFLTAGAAFIVHIYLGYLIRSAYPDFNSNKLIIYLVASVAFVTTYFLLSQNKKLFVISICFYAILSTALVNPLYRGLDAVIDNQLSRDLKKIEKDNTKKRPWVVYDNILLTNYIVANGIHSLDSVHLYPQTELWEKFDPEHKYYTIWNRYAHVTFSTETNLEKIEFTLGQDDVFIVKANPCNKVFEKLEVKYFVLNYIADYSCLKQIKELDYLQQPLYVYERSNF